MNKVFSTLVFSFILMINTCSNRLALAKGVSSSFEFKGELRSVASFDDYYYLLTYNNRLYRLNKNTCTLDSTYVVNFDGEELRSIHISQGMVYAESVDKYYLLKNGKWKYLRKIVADFPGTKIFEDEYYKVSRICQGEFGGTIFFKHKSTGDIYETLCTCAFDVQKSSKGYFVAATLGHGNGSVRIYKIADPKKLTAYRTKNFKKGFRQDINREIAMQGKMTIFESNNQLCVGKYVQEDKMFFVLLKTMPITGNFAQLGIFTINNDSLKLTQEIKSKYIDIQTEFWGNEFPRPFVTYESEKSTGFIDFTSGKIVFYDFPLKKDD